jgi:hypothetical protein
MARWCVFGPAAVSPGVRGRPEKASATTLAYLRGLFFSEGNGGSLSEIAIGEPIGKGIGKPLRFHVGGNL